MLEASDYEACNRFKWEPVKRKEFYVVVFCTVWEVVSELMKAKENDRMSLNFSADMPLSTLQVFLVQQKERLGYN